MPTELLRRMTDSRPSVFRPRTVVPFAPLRPPWPRSGFAQIFTTVLLLLRFLQVGFPSG